MQDEFLLSNDEYGLNYGSMFDLGLSRKERVKTFR